MIPYEPASSLSIGYRTINDDLRDSLNETSIDPSTARNRDYIEEVKLIQLCLGVEPDGIIGPKTRAAARAVWDERIGEGGSPPVLPEDSTFAPDNPLRRSWRDVPVTAGMLCEGLEFSHYACEAIQRLAKEKLK